MINRRRIAAIAGSSVLAVSAALGLTACATTSTTTSNSQAAPSQGGGQQIDTTAMAKALATKLGVDESKVKTALDTALQSAMPSGGGGAPSGAPSGGAPSGAPGNGSAPSGAPSGGASQGGGQPGGGDNTQMLTAIAKSMASQLNLKQATVLSALQEVWSSYGPSGQPSAAATS